MEDNQQIAETGSAVADMNLQETVRISQDEEERNEVFHDSLTEEQWRQQLDAPASGTESAPQYREQTGEGTAEGGTGQYPPTPIMKSQNDLSRRRKPRFVQ